MRIASPFGVTGVVLNGGQSSRFGTDKSDFVIGPGSMAGNAIATVSSVIGEVIVAGKAMKDFPGEISYVQDTIVNGGPLAALAAAFGATGTEWLFVLACDMPNVTGPTIKNLISRRTRDSLAIVPRDRSGRIHPLFACYHRSTRDLCDRLLAQGIRSMKRFIESVAGHGLVLYPTVEEDTLLNINRPSDLARLRPTSDAQVPRLT